MFLESTVLKRMSLRKQDNLDPEVLTLEIR